MKRFLGQALNEIIHADDVEVEGKTVRISGPLSGLFTEALNVELKKEDYNPTPVVSSESFTDPEVIVKHLVEEIKNTEPTENPLQVYAFDKTQLDEKTFVDIIDNIETIENPKEFILVKTWNSEGNEKGESNVVLENMLINITSRRGIRYIK